MADVSELFVAAINLQQAGLLEEAKKKCDAILSTQPEHAGAWHLLGVIAAQMGQLDLAFQRIARALEKSPDLAEAHANLGAVLHRQGKFHEAIPCYHRALQLDPNLPAGHFNLGDSLRSLGKLTEALASYRRATELRPAYWKAYNNMSVALRHLGHLDEALLCARRALEILPGYVEAHNNLGNILRDQGRFEEAAASYQRAIDLDPNAFKTMSNLGTVFAALGQYEDTADSFRRSLEVEPEYADAHWNQSLLMLLRGDLENGWREFEWRWRTEPQENRKFPQPTWHGESLHGKTILLHAEQGLGDTFQFIRYASLLKQKDESTVIVVECQTPLAKLLGSYQGIDQLIPAGQSLPHFDVHLPLMSLPLVFNTRLDSVPATIPYLFADAALIEQWRAKLSSVEGFRIGVNWHGREGHRTAWRRDLPIGEILSLAEIPDVRLISLQKGAGQRELSAGSGDWPITEFGDDLDTTHGPFMDTAAIMMNLDLVITSDTSVAHLAGALGVPVWVPLPFVPDWRWLLDRSDSPWYPTMRLFRQKRAGDWAGVFEEIRSALEKRIIQHSQ